MKLRSLTLCLLLLTGFSTAFPSFWNSTSPLSTLLSDTTVTEIRVRSELLSQFHHRDTFVEAIAVLPADYHTSSQRYPTVFHIHGFGGNHIEGYQRADGLQALMKKDPKLSMVHIFLNASASNGAFHSFVDSENNGPWGSALITEFLPRIEKQFRLIPASSARFLTGHSSGGWASLWLQIYYPNMFGGVWATSPDPVDFRSFFGVDLTPGSTDNMYLDRGGHDRKVYRNRPITVKQFVEMEEAQQDLIGEYASYEWSWSPKGSDGKPLQFFNRKTGELNQLTLNDWQRFNLHQLLSRNNQLLSQVQGKLHILCGQEDTFFLEQPTKLLCDFLNSQDTKGYCLLVPGKTHTDLYAPHELYPQGLERKISHEIRKVLVADSQKE